MVLIITKIFIMKIPNFHIEILKHFEYLVEILWQNIVS